ncbi:phage terminase large subunit [Pasteurella multocida]|uniref:phage terminase large subunit n=1 Tax=Pasteurella multocida TaxID=747 RepID=UPI002B4AA744|nr:phage terminase large subunit [Pasteurella multocida]WRK07708.1 phage terminase large subunit [Pasteurella multocida]
MFQDGVCHICAKLDKGLLDIKPSPEVEEKSQVEAQQEQEELLRLQAEADRVRQEREVEFNLQQEAIKELAKREAARRNLLPFVMYFNEAYTPGWVHADICRRLERFSREVAEGKSPRLMLSMPPRSGKSELASKTFPAWHLGHHPNHEIIGTSYSAALAIDFSRKVRGLVQDERYHNIFPTRMDETSQSAERWNTAQGGGYVAAGVQGPITGRGAHCFPAGTKVLMADGTDKNIEDVCVGDVVVSFDTDKNEYRINKVIAGQVKYASGFTEIRTSSGGSTRATSNHRFYSPSLGGWYRADELKARDEVILSPSHDTLRKLWLDYGETHIRGDKSRKTWSHSNALFPDMQRAAPKGRIWDEMRYVRGSGEAQQKILLKDMHTESACGRGQELCCVWCAIPPEQHKCGALLSEMCECDPLYPNARGGESELQARERTQGEFLQSETTREGERRLPVCGMWFNRESPHSPQGRGQTQRLYGKSSNRMCELPHDSPQIESDSISSAITYDTGVVELVYDIQIENTACFFADGILAHNCAIIDDPVKDREAAESEINRQAVKDWYSSTLYTRLAPGGGILVIQTRWHEDDLSGWLLSCMKEAEQELAETGEWPEDADRWEVVKYPAIATRDEEYRKAGEALHPERYDIKALNKIKRTLIPRDWEALYQQNPVSADGDYFKKEHFRLYDTAPDINTLRVYAAWDLAIGKKDSNDYTCGAVVGIDRSNDIWVLHRYYGRWSADELIQKFFECQDTWSPVLQGIEHGQIEMTLEPFILKEMNEKKKKFNYIKLKTRGNDKMTRARPIQGRMEQGRVHFPRQAPWFQEMQNEMLAFPSGKHDDQVDALAWIGQMILMLAPEREKQPPPKRGWRDRLRKQLKGTPIGVSHMAS